MIPVEVGQDDEVDIARSEVTVGEQSVERTNVDDVVESLTGVSERARTGLPGVGSVLVGATTYVDEDVESAIRVGQEPDTYGRSIFSPKLCKKVNRLVSLWGRNAITRGVTVKLVPFLPPLAALFSSLRLSAPRRSARPA